MKRRLTRAVALGLSAVVAAIAPNGAIAQERAGKGAAEPADAAAKAEALEAARRRWRRAVEILDDLGGRARDLPAGSHVRVLACLADALWESDAERAVRLARRAYDEAESDVSPSEAGSEAHVARRERETLLAVVRRHDVALARELAARLARDVPAVDPDGGADKPEDVPRLLAAARDLAPDDPAAAAALVRRALDTGEVPDDLWVTLEAIQQRASALAASLVASAIERLRARGASPAAVRFVALPFDFGADGSATLDADRLNADVARAYLEAELAYLTTLATAEEESDAEAASRAYHDTAWLVQYVDRLDPERSGAVRELAARLRTRVPPELAAATDAWVAGDFSGSSARLGEWGAGAASEDQDDINNRDGALWSAATDAAEDGDLARARDLASKIRNDDTRQEVFDSVADRGMTGAERAGRYDDVRRLASEISDPSWRARALAGLADTELAAGKRERALDLYADAYRVLTAGGTMAPTDGAQELLAYARALAPSDRQLAFTVLGDAVGATNRNKKSRLCSSLCDRGCSNPYSETFSVFATLDFDRALDAAKSLDDPYFRHYALLGAATGALREDAKVLADARTAPAADGAYAPPEPPR